ncbi:putative P2Y purinoceptor 10 [Kryptolebias marmoratus]|uniref:P2Y receptor family member 10 n=1 Tax=Kryptolebias marmoratus TaxID=37003 RepID=A0A3Q3G9C3_KRYMA|nr:putative P2Y purinoceptor 10 [Kryptolebias marmoratus]XP_024862469.1 putative P2Y purinoceptor 10 [Kryptolebias marmoratus]XP_037833264.1 putative P2Y purinoceptor 10 [Kryptolebias marmoratus]
MKHERVKKGSAISVCMRGKMSQNTTLCNDSSTNVDEILKLYYAGFFLLLFIPGLLLNTAALWVLCRHIWKKTKTVIFMINLAAADLVHILSLPLRIYYYFNHNWPFGKAVCMICFYLRYLNMYAAIAFLMCISIQRYAFLLNPFSARRWRRRYDLLISVILWVVVGLACSPFILMRSSSRQQQSTNVSASANTSDSDSCFKDLPMRKVSLRMAAIIITFTELFGFLIPLICIIYCSVRIAWSLNRKQSEDQQTSASLSPSTRSRLQSVTSNGHTSKNQEKDRNREKRRALRIVLSCSALFLFCFAPYHINFVLYMMVSQDLVENCGIIAGVKLFHPVSLCVASLSCCLNPLLYYFLNAEFRMHFMRTSSVSSSILSSPVSSPTECPTQTRLLKMESKCSENVKAE